MAYEVYPIYGLEIEFNSTTGRFDEIISYKDNVNKLIYVDVGVILVFAEEQNVRHEFIPLDAISKITYKTQRSMSD